MHCLGKLTKTIKPKQNNSKLTHTISFVVGAAMAGAATILLTKYFCEKPENVNTNAEKENDEVVDIIKAEIKQTLEKVDDASMGDVGIAMEKALED